MFNEKKKRKSTVVRVAVAPGIVEVVRAISTLIPPAERRLMLFSIAHHFTCRADAAL